MSDKHYILRPTVANQSTFDLGDLNDEQKEAVLHQHGPLMVIAGAGSGKTKTLGYRVARLIHDGVDPKRILLLTFTRKSSQEMLRRASGLLDARCQKVMGGTFHAFCNMTLHKYASVIQYPDGFTIMDRADAENLMSLIRKEGDYQKKDKRFPKRGTLLDIHSKSVNTNRSIEQVLVDDFPHFEMHLEAVLEITKLYHIRKEMLSLMDYDDLLVKTRHLLTHHDDVRETLSKQYQYILVDEFQDTNHLQLGMLQKLCDQHQNIMAVGDDAQSIYSFRGADVSNMLDFEQHFSQVKVVNLNFNYRSTQHILNLSNDVINASSQMFSKDLKAATDEEKKPVFIDAYDDYEQAEFVTQRILESREDGVDLRSMAVLFRSSSHSNQLEVSLQRANIPFKKFGGFKFTETAHVKDALAYIRVMVNSDDQISWHRILQQFEGVGPKLSQKLIDYIGAMKANPNQMDFSLVKSKACYDDLLMLKQLIWGTNLELSPSDILQKVIDAYKPILKKQYDDYHKREQDLQSLVTISERFRSVTSMLDSFTLEPPETSQVGADAVSDDDEYVVLSTIHSAKGLEWGTVFVLSVVDGYLPSFRALHDPDQIEEERRLMYVAITRAKRELYLIKPNLEAPGTYYPTGGMGFSQCSRFLTPVMIDDNCERWSLGVGSVGISQDDGGEPQPRYSL